jgi:hypothetical protein
MSKPVKPDNPGSLFSALDSEFKPEFNANGQTLVKMGDHIIGQAKSMSKRIQQWAVYAALHTAQFGDTTEVTRVLKELSDAGIRSNALRFWFCHKDTGAPFKWLPKEGELPARLGYDKDKAEKLAERYAADPDAVVQFLLSKRFETMSKEPEFEGFDLQKMVNRLVAQATKVKADPTKKDHPKNNIDPALLANLAALANGAPKGATVN